MFLITGSLCSTLHFSRMQPAFHFLESQFNFVLHSVGGMKNGLGVCNVAHFRATRLFFGRLPVVPGKAGSQYKVDVIKLLVILNNPGHIAVHERSM